MTTPDAALAALSAAIGQSILPAPVPVVKDFGLAPNTLDQNTQNYLNGLGAAVREMAGNLGDVNNKAVRFSDLVQRGFAKPISYQPAFSGSPGPPGVGVPGPPGPSYVPDSTLPPTPSGLTASAGLTTVIVQWTGAVYTQGHGPKQTNVYIVRKAAADPTLPTFPGAAGLAIAAPHALNIIDVPADTNTRLHIWITFVTVDGYESAAPAGGTNGFQVTTGKIGNTDLNDLIITAEKLSQGTYPNINLVPNPGSEDGLVSWRAPYEWVGVSGTLTLDTTNKTGGNSSFLLSKSAGTDGIGVDCTGFPVIPGETYSVKLRTKANTASGVQILRIIEVGLKPVAPGFITRASYTDLYNGAPPTIWTAYEFSYTVPAGVYWAALAVYLWAGGTATTLNFDDVSVGRQITASFLAANSIAVGSAAIANAAITNVMLGTAIVDDAKIANLSASKLSVGTGIIGGNLKSSNYSAGTAGWILQPGGYAEFGAAVIRDQLVASQIDTRGLSIKDAGGGIVLQAGSALSRATPSGTMNTDPDCLGPDTVEWSYAGCLATGISGGVTGTTCLRSPDTGSSNHVYGIRTFPLDRTKAIRVSALVRKNTGAVNGIFYLGLQAFDSSGTAQYGFSLYTYYSTTVSSLSTTFSRISFIIPVATLAALNAAVVRMSPHIILGYTGAGPAVGGTIDAQDFRIEEVATFDSNIAGQITAANASTYIANVAIGTAQIALASIGTAQVSVLTAANLTVAALSNTVNGSTSTGQRIELAANVIRVYDASNVIRVKLGDLT